MSHLVADGNAAPSPFLRELHLHVQVIAVCSSVCHACEGKLQVASIWLNVLDAVRGGHFEVDMSLYFLLS